MRVEHIGINHFVENAKWHCEELGVPFKALLLMDNAPCYPDYLQYLHPYVLVVFMTPKQGGLVKTNGLNHVV